MVRTKVVRTKASAATTSISRGKVLAAPTRRRRAGLAGAKPFQGSLWRPVHRPPLAPAGGGLSPGGARTTFTGAFSDL